ncbi:MAG: hypothetical protein LBD53_04580 [Tannerella sp.]|nr:hypothetical protein [Tannerella sp.]
MTKQRSALANYELRMPCASLVSDKPLAAVEKPCKRFSALQYLQGIRHCEERSNPENRK